MKKINIAIVGLGFGAEFIPIYQKHPLANMYAICQRDEAKLNAIGDAFNIEKRYSNFDELLKDANVDAVHINTPIQSHAEQTIKALNAGKHVACTVPMATTVEECRLICEAVQKSGKTYMIGGVIIKQLNIMKKLNVLIITPAPTETLPQFTDDLFNKFKDFDKFTIHHIEGSKKLNSLELDNNNIFVMSKQLLQKYINEKTIMIIKNLKLDIIAFDENHFSGTTNLSKNILDSYSSKNTVKIYLTATYNKPLQEWNILPECQMYWDIEDEQICKSILVDNTNLNKLKEKHGDEYI